MKQTLLAASVFLPTYFLNVNISPTPSEAQVLEDVGNETQIQIAKLTPKEERKISSFSIDPVEHTYNIALNNKVGGVCDRELVDDIYTSCKINNTNILLVVTGAYSEIIFNTDEYEVSFSVEGENKKFSREEIFAIRSFVASALRDVEIVQK